MKTSIVLVLGASWSLALAPSPAFAGPRHHLHHYRGMPPIAGTLRMHPTAFGRGDDAAFPTAAHGNRSLSAIPDASAGSTYRGRGRPLPVAPEIGSVGTGVGLSAPLVTGWGTADSATSGGAYPVPSSRTGSARFDGYRAEIPVSVRYGEPDSLPRGYGVPATGGLAYYNSGSRGRMAYYGSSSSAGYGGTPGGLAIYSSGAYGPGATIVHVGRRAAWPVAYGYGPHIIHVGYHHRHLARW